MFSVNGTGMPLIKITGTRKQTFFVSIMLAQYAHTEENNVWKGTGLSWSRLKNKFHHPSALGSGPNKQM